MPANKPRFMAILLCAVVASLLFTRDASAQTALLTNPANGQLTANLASPFQWTAVAGAQAYYLYVGTSAGSKNLIDSGELQGTSYISRVSLPLGQLLYARLSTKVDGVWRYTDSTFACDVATLVSPANGTMTATVIPSFQWTTVPGAQAYYLYVGTSVGAKNLIDSGEVQSSSYTSKVILPAGQLLYARVSTKLNGVWRFTDSVFGAYSAALVSPANGTMTADFSQPFQWTGVPGAQAYYLYVGTSVGAKNLVDSGEIATTSYTSRVALPAGQILYARLSTKVDGVWRYTDSTFGSYVASLLSPVNGTMTANFAQPLQWTTVPGAQAYYLYVGSVPGAKDLVDSGELHRTSYTAASLPAGRVVYARLFTETGNVWRYTDAALGAFAAYTVSPASGTLTADFTQPFQWTTIPRAQAYYLYVGTTPGAKNLIDSGELQATSYIARVALPAGQVLYVRLFTKVDGVWRYTDSTSGSYVASLLTPPPGTTTANFAQSFAWTSVPGAQAYYLYVGTTPGAKNLIDTGELQGTSYTARTALPAGQMLFARLWTETGGAWRYSDSTFGAYAAKLTSPANGTMTANVAQPFQWNSVPNAQAYYLYVGTSVGAKNLVDSGEVQGTSYIPRGQLPLAQTLYARLSTKVDGVWRFTDSTFASYAAQLQPIADGAGRGNRSQALTWTAVPGAQAYYLYIGTTAGAKNIVDTGELHVTNIVVNGLPVGQRIYLRLWTEFAGIWRSSDSTYVVLPDEPTVQSGNLIYMGSFGVPHTDVLRVPGTSEGFDYGGAAPAFNPLNNTLFLLSHVYDQQPSELSIPAALGQGGQLPTADVVQGFANALEGHLLDVAQGDTSASVRVGGALVYNGQLYLDTHVYYGASAEPAFFRRSVDLSATGTLQGGMAIGPLHSDFYNGYMALVPPEWQTALAGPVLVGDCCLSIISRTSYGPAASSVDLSQLSESRVAPATGLVYYPQEHPTLGDWGQPGTNIFWNGATQIKGAVFPNGTSSVLFFGRHGLGPYCYGEAVACGDFEDTSKGDHAYPYEYYVWAYDAHDLAAVKAGAVQPWDVRPYAVWSLQLPTISRSHDIGGVAYDPSTGRIFVSQMFGDGDYPVIHVFTIH